MANGRVYGTRITSIRNPSVDYQPCPRCGVERATHANKKGQKKRTGLCRDCSSAMSPVEREEWRK